VRSQPTIAAIFAAAQNQRRGRKSLVWPKHFPYCNALEDAEDYAAFEMAVIADYDAQSAAERELVLRLASLLWRLRRATAIESGLFKIQAQHCYNSGDDRKLIKSAKRLSTACIGLPSYPTTRNRLWAWKAPHRRPMNRPIKQAI
jgi:hypothetical protein